MTTAARRRPTMKLIQLATPRVSSRMSGRCSRGGRLLRMAVSREKAADDDSDVALLARIATRDADAFEQLYDRHVARVIAFSARMLFDRDDAEDVVHELFRQIWDGGLRYDAARGRFVPWVFAMARNRCIDRIRSGARRAGLLDAAAHEPADSPQRNPEGDTLLAEERRRVRAAMTLLPAEQREAIETCFHRGLTHKEAAEHLGLPLGTLKSRVKMAMDRLRQNLAESGARS